MAAYLKSFDFCCFRRNGLRVCSFLLDLKISFNHRLFNINVKSHPKCTAVLNTVVEASLESECIKHKDHPGLRNIGCVKLPEPLQNAVNNILLKYSGKQLEGDAEKLAKYLKFRQLPLDEKELKIKAAQIEKEIAEEEDIDFLKFDEEYKEKFHKSLKTKVMQKLNFRSSNWKPVNYDSYNGILYIVGRLAPNYAALQKVFTEIKVHDPTFAPKTLFNFGSGVGSAIWSSHNVWGRSLVEYFCVDSSNEMNTLAQLLLNDGKENKNMFLKGLFFRHFLPSSTILKYDLVVTAYSLLELPSSEHRLQVIENLWHKTQDMLVIIENGSNAGYITVLEARDYILQLGTSSCKQPNDIHVVAPCSHEFLCPRFIDGSKTPCNFEVRYQPLLLNTRRKKSDIERFCYVILRKGQRSPDDECWPRIVRPVLCRSRHVVCKMCCSDGKLHELRCTKHKHGRHLYRCARCSEWGDLLPAKIISCNSYSKESAM